MGVLLLALAGEVALLGYYYLQGDSFGVLGTLLVMAITASLAWGRFEDSRNSREKL